VPAIRAQAWFANRSPDPDPTRHTVVTNPSYWVYTIFPILNSRLTESAKLEKGKK